MSNNNRRGFTLIELSIVLVIIGLIVGGILVGQDLIRSATVRAQISQIDKYNTAVEAFYGKYGGIPGDITLAKATQFGFTVGSGCNGTQGGRDGNGLLDANSSPTILYQGLGEVELFWLDLSTAGYLDAAFPANGAGAVLCFMPPSVWRQARFDWQAGQGKACWI